MTSRFLQKAEREIVRKLGRILLEIKDPRLEGCFSLSRVRLSADLSHLKCWFVINEDPDKQYIMLEALKRAVPFLRRRLGESIRFKRTPAIQVLHDQTPERVERIEEVIEQLHRSGQLCDEDRENQESQDVPSVGEDVL